MSIRLYDLANEYAALQQAADEGEDVQPLLDQLQGDVEAKGAGIVRVLANLEAAGEAYGKEEQRLKAKRVSYERAVERMRAHIKACMHVAGVTSITGPTFKLLLVKGKPAIEVHSLDALEEAAPELVRVTTSKSADKAGVLARYQRDGECLPGTEVVPTLTLRVS